MSKSPTYPPRLPCYSPLGPTSPTPLHNTFLHTRHVSINLAHDLAYSDGFRCKRAGILEVWVWKVAWWQRDRAVLVMARGRSHQLASLIGVHVGSLPTVMNLVHAICRSILHVRKLLNEPHGASTDIHKY